MTEAIAFGNECGEQEKQARAVVNRILDLLPARSPYADHLRKQVKGVLPAIRRMVEQQDRIQLYLEYDVYNDQLAVGREDPGAVRTLEQRKAELTQRLDSALTDLKRIETRVAAHVLGARDSFEEEAVREELSDTLEDLEMLLEEDKAAGLLPES